MSGPHKRAGAADDREGSVEPDTTYSRRRLLSAAGLAGVTLLAGCTGGESAGGATDDGAGGGAGGSTPTPDATSSSAETAMADGTSGEVPTWRTTELTAVRSDETFTIDGLEGPVVIQGFAVWCPKCQRQSEKLSEVTDDVTVVSLNVDPNEDASAVAEHADSNGFDWRFAVAPTGMTQSLIDEFGTAVTTPPSTPVIVACPGGGSTFMSGSINSPSEVRSAVDEC